MLVALFVAGFPSSFIYDVCGYIGTRPENGIHGGHPQRLVGSLSVGSVHVCPRRRKPQCILPCGLLDVHRGLCVVFWHLLRPSTGVTHHFLLARMVVSRCFLTLLHKMLGLVRPFIGRSGLFSKQSNDVFLPRGTALVASAQSAIHGDEIHCLGKTLVVGRGVSGNGSVGL